MENEEKDVELSIVELLKIIWKRKIIVIIATIVIALLGFVVVKYTYNKTNEFYTSVINYSFPGIETGKYPDGTVFDYHDIVSKETLLEIKNSNPDFNDIDFDKMILNNNIEIIKAIDEDDKIIENTFILNFSKSYFKNNNIAREFAEAVLSYPILKANMAIDNIKYDKFLIHYDNPNTTYGEKINMVVEQYNFLNEGYQNIINERGDYLLSDGFNISDKINELDFIITGSSIYSLYNILEQEGFVNNPTREKSLLEVQKNQYQISINNNTAIIDDLMDIISSVQSGGISGSTTIFEEYNKIIAQKIVENVELNYKISVIDIQLDKIDNMLTDPQYIEKKSSFDTKLDTAYNSLLDASENYKSAYKEVYEANNNYHFELSGIIAKNGGINPLITLILFSVVGFIGSSIVIIIIDKNKNEGQN